MDIDALEKRLKEARTDAGDDTPGTGGDGK